MIRYTTEPAQQQGAVPTAIRREYLPMWLRHRLIPHRIPSDCHDSYQTLLRLAHRPWLDRWGTTKLDGREVFVAEPENLSSQDVQNIRQLCRRLGLIYTIQRSPTIRVIFIAKEKGADR